MHSVRRVLVTVAIAGITALGFAPAIASAATQHVAKASHSVSTTKPVGLVLAKTHYNAKKRTTFGVIALNIDNSLAWTTHGTTNPVTVEHGSGETEFYETVVTGAPGYVKLHVENSTHCAKDSSGNNIGVSDCNPGQLNQEFLVDGNGEITDNQFHSYAAVLHDAAGQEVVVTTGGGDIRWTSAIF